MLLISQSARVLANHKELVTLAHQFRSYCNGRLLTS
jgi:hypothetical protein